MYIIFVLLKGKFVEFAKLVTPKVITKLSKYESNTMDTFSNVLIIIFLAPVVIAVSYVR